MCEVLESLIRGKIMKHMQENKVFNDKQNGFISEKSTVLQLIKVIDEWKRRLDEGGTLDIACCDIMKASDTVSHQRLLEKVKDYYVKGDNT